MSKKSNINNAELRGLTGLFKDATIHVTNLVEEMNYRMVHPPFLVSTPLQHLITGISGIAYHNVRFATKLISRGLDESLKQFNPLFGVDIPLEKKDAALGILNGVIGDYLDKSKNPLAIQMQFRRDGQVVSPSANPNVNGKILVLVHGLCMNDFLWRRNGHDHGEALEKELSKTAIYLRYNTGLHISTNGQKLNSILEELVQNWAVPVEEIVIVAHSMGGLVSRSAIYYGQKEAKNWTKYLKKTIFLGSPHHGAPLEQMGNYIDQIFDALPYLKPFARLAKIRSSGITDLRFGNLVDEDWNGADRFKKNVDERKPIPLAEQLDYYTIAATMGKEADDLGTRLLGDGLVRLESALGLHQNPDKNLKFKESNRYVVYESNHLDLLNSLEVYKQIKKWMS